MKLLPFVLFLVLTACGNQSNNIKLKNVKPGNVQFFETYGTNEILDSWNAACNWAHDHDSLSLNSTLHLDELNPRDLRRIVQVINQKNAFAYAEEEHIPIIDSILAIPGFKSNFPKNLRFMWSFGLEESPNGEKMYALYAVKVPDGNKAIVDGKSIKSAETAIADYNQMPVIRISMNDQGAHDWEIMTRKNIGRPIAITIDNRVLSCPVVNDAIAGGKTEISGNFSVAEAEELAARINAGK
nr:hypothetical protein [uncultured Fluviicola sp.]